MAARCNRAGHYIFALWFLLSIYLSIHLSICLSTFSLRLISAAGDWMSTYFYTRCGPSANLECRSETCCTRLAGNGGPKKSPKIRHLGTIAQVCRAISSTTSSQLRHLSTKILLNSNVFPRVLTMNFGPLAAEVCWRVWGTPAHFNGFGVLAALLHGTLVVGVSQTSRR